MLHIMASYCLSKVTKIKSNGKRYPFYTLRKVSYIKETQSSKTTYIAYVGSEPILPESKALQLCEQEGVTLDKLRKVNRLKIIPDDEYERLRQARRDAQKEARRLAKELSSNDKPNNTVSKMEV